MARPSRLTTGLDHHEGRGWRYDISMKKVVTKGPEILGSEAVIAATNLKRGGDEKPEVSLQKR